MKAKILSIVLIVAMVVCSYGIAMADTTTWNGTSYTGDTSKDVSVTIERASGSYVYSVDIVWGDLKYAYGRNVQWNPSSMEYVPVTTSGSDSWSLYTESGDTSDTTWEDGKISIDNRSEKVVYATMAYNFLDATTTGITGGFSGKFYKNETLTTEFTDGYATLGTAADSTTGTRNIDLYFNVLGAITSAKSTAVNKGITLGTVTISITDTEPVA